MRVPTATGEEIVTMDAAPMSTAFSVLATMATPAVLLLANAMLILSTNQRLQAILARIEETELALLGSHPASQGLDPELLERLLGDHARRAAVAHRALLACYTSAGLFATVVIALGGAALEVPFAVPLAVAAAFLGCGVLLLGLGLLIRETKIGVGALDRRLTAVLALCRLREDSIDAGPDPR